MLFAVDVEGDLAVVVTGTFATDAGRAEVERQLEQLSQLPR